MPIQCLSNRYMWRCGTYTGFRHGEEGELCPEEKRFFGIFVSRIYDSGEAGMEWNRLELDISQDMFFEAHVWIADDIRDRDLPQDVEELYGHVAGNARYVSNYREMLLYGKGCGRYAMFAVKIFYRDTKEAAFRRYRLTFPKESFTRYLPAIYQNNRHLERFLAVHESIYLGVERAIDSFAENMDYELGDQSLARLAGWMGWGDIGEKTDKDTLRRLLRTGISLACRKGSCSYYTELAEILIGKKTVLIEEPELRRATLLIRECPEKGWEKKLEWLKKNVPIGIEMDFVVLHETDKLDGQFFLDETAYLSKTDSELTCGGIEIDRILLL